MKTILIKKIILITTYLVLCFVYESYSQESKQLYQKGLQKEEGEGNLKEAITIYNKVVENKSAERIVRANALLHIGLCYEKLGNEEAQKAYQRLISDFADQDVVVALARKKLMAITTENSGNKNGGIVTREVWSTEENVYVASPDGRYLTFIDWETISLNVHDIKTDKNWLVSKKGTWEGISEWPEDNIFSPDSRQIAYGWGIGDSTELRIVNLDGSDTRILCKGYYLSPVDWSSDGKYILTIFVEFLNKKEPNKYKSHIARVSVKDGSIEIIRSENGVSHTHPCFSDNNQSIIFTLSQDSDSNKTDIFQQSIDGSKESVIIKHPANDRSPLWIKGSNYLTFISDRSGSNGLWGQEVHNGVPSGESIMLKANLDDRPNPKMITNDGSYIYSTDIKEVDVFSAKIDRNSHMLLSDPIKISRRFEGKNCAPSFSPDGKYVAYLSMRMGWVFWGSVKMDFVIQNLETGEEYDLNTNLHSGNYMYGFNPQWSPDSKHLLLHGKLEQLTSENGFYLVDIKTGEQNPVLLNVLKPEKSDFETPEIKSFPYYFPGGKSLFCLSESQKGFIKFNIETKTANEFYVGDEEIHYPALSPDGKYVAFRYSSENPHELWMISTKGGEPIKVGSLSDDDSIDWPVWTPDSENIFIIARNSKKVHKFPIDGSESSILNISIKGTPSCLRIHPDGKSIVYSERYAIGYKVWAIDNVLPKK